MNLDRKVVHRQTLVAWPSSATAASQNSGLLDWQACTTIWIAWWALMSQDPNVYMWPSVLCESAVFVQDCLHIFTPTCLNHTFKLDGKCSEEGPCTKDPYQRVSSFVIGALAVPKFRPWLAMEPPGQKAWGRVLRMHLSQNLRFVDVTWNYVGNSLPAQELHHSTCLSLAA